MRAAETTSPPSRLAYVIDTSVFTKFFLDDEKLVDEARAVFRAYRAGQLELVAAFPLFYEVPQSLLRAARLGRIDPETGRRALDAFTRLPLRRVDLGPDDFADLLRRSYRIAELIHRSFYDAVFVATAERLEIPLLTADQPTVAASQGHFDVVHLEGLVLQ